MICLSNIKYHITLSADGKHSASITSNDPQAATQALEWLRATNALLASPATLPAAPAPVQPPYEQVNLDLSPAPAKAQAPLCRIHGGAMKLMNGKRGEFWSCHERNADGSWCSYRPPAQE